MNETLSKTLDQLQARMFFMNKKSDRIASLLKHDFRCIVFADIFHNDYAHFWALKAADKIVEIKDLTGTSSLYPAVEAGEEIFETMTDMFSFLYDITVETQEQLQEAIDLAEQLNNMFIKVALEDMIVRLQKVVYSAEALKNKAILYNENVILFDMHAPEWYVKIFDVM